MTYLRTAENLPRVLAVLLLYACEVQSELDGGEKAILDPEYATQQAQKFAKPGDLAGIFRFFSTLEILTPQWCSLLAAAETPVFPEGTRKLARYFVERYWLQAVSDYDLMGRVKFAVLSCILICALPGDFCRNAQLYSKEIENSCTNVEAILDGAYADPAFTDLSLLGLLSNS